MSYIFHLFFYDPFYNLLVFFINIPRHDAGIAVVLVTIVVSLLIFSISKKAIRTQLKLKELEPEIEKIKKNIKDKAEQARAMLDLYKKNEVNPFSAVLIAFIQFPILFALYLIFWKSGLPSVQTDILYSFVKVPEMVNMNFLGILDIGQKSIPMSVIAGIAQFIQAWIAFPSKKKNENDEPKEKSFSQDFAHSMQTQMKYVFPFIIGFISASLPSALPLYWATRSLFTAGQEVFVKRSLSREKSK